MRHIKPTPLPNGTIQWQYRAIGKAPQKTSTTRFRTSNKAAHSTDPKMKIFPLLDWLGQKIKAYMSETWPVLYADAVRYNAKYPEPSIPRDVLPPTILSMRLKARGICSQAVPKPSGLRKSRKSQG